MKPTRLLILLILLLGLAACNRGQEAADAGLPAGQEEASLAGMIAPSAGPVQLQASGGEDVFVRVNGAEEQRLSQDQPLPVEVGTGVRVAQSSLALLSFADFLTVEVMQGGSLQLQDLLLTPNTAEVSLSQRGGTFLNSMERLTGDGPNRVFQVESDYGQIVAQGAQFVLTRESHTPLEWVIALSGGAESVRVTPRPGMGGPGQTVTLSPGQAVWIGPEGSVGPTVTFARDAVDGWLASAQQGAPLREIGDTILSHADVLTNTVSFVSSLPVDASLIPVDLPFSVEGVDILFEGAGRTGAGRYMPEDCNNDGIMDVAIQDGLITFDFRHVPARVRAIDVTVLNWGAADRSYLAALNAGQQVLSRRAISVGPGQIQTVSLRADARQNREPYQFAQLAIERGCLLGFSLTPPQANGEPGQVRSLFEESRPPAPQATVTPLARLYQTECQRLRPSGWGVYRVQPGDNLTEIASSTGTTVARLIQVNCLLQPGIIVVDQLIYVPDPITTREEELTPTVTPTITPTVTVTGTPMPPVDPKPTATPVPETPETPDAAEPEASRPDPDPADQARASCQPLGAFQRALAEPLAGESVRVSWAVAGGCPPVNVTVRAVTRPDQPLTEAALRSYSAQGASGSLLDPWSTLCGNGERIWYHIHVTDGNNAARNVYLPFELGPLCRSLGPTGGGD